MTSSNLTSVVKYIKDKGGLQQNEIGLITTSSPSSITRIYSGKEVSQKLRKSIFDQLEIVYGKTREDIIKLDFDPKSYNKDIITKPLEFSSAELAALSKISEIIGGNISVDLGIQLVKQYRSNQFT